MVDIQKEVSDAIAVSRELQRIANIVRQEIIAITGHDIAFSLVVFTEGRLSYISNARREDVIPVYRGMLKSWEAGTPDIPAHEVQ